MEAWRLAIAGKKYYRCPISPCSPSWMISPHLWRASPHRYNGSDTANPKSHSNPDRRVAALDGMVEQYMSEYVQAWDALNEILGSARRSAHHLCF